MLKIRVCVLCVLTPAGGVAQTVPVGWGGEGGGGREKECQLAPVGRSSQLQTGPGESGPPQNGHLSRPLPPALSSGGSCVYILQCQEFLSGERGCGSTQLEMFEEDYFHSCHIFRATCNVSVLRKFYHYVLFVGMGEYHWWCLPLGTSYIRIGKCPLHVTFLSHFVLVWLCSRWIRSVSVEMRVGVRRGVSS